MLLSSAALTELHVHPAGCLTTQDILEMAHDHFREIDWSYMVDRHTQAFGAAHDPIALISSAIEEPDAFESLRSTFEMSEHDAGSFDRFGARMSMVYCVLDHFQKLGRWGDGLRCCIEEHERQGLRYVEYRSMSAPGNFEAYHLANITAIVEAERLDARYIISLRRTHAVEDLESTIQLLETYPVAKQIVVGLDFCNIEEGHPPKDLKPFFERLDRENSDAKLPLEVVCHVGESYFDKSLESAVRWCHEVALLGARRLGHATALGLPPEVSVDRRPGAHERELVSERLDQIEYDLANRTGLSRYEIEIRVSDLLAEKNELASLSPEDKIDRPYDSNRLDEITRRQAYVLDELARLGTIIETCPTSNLLIGGVPDPACHPVHRFLDSDVNLAICADDPGVFATTLKDEVDWVANHTKWNRTALGERLGDPYRFRLGQG